MPIGETALVSGAIFLGGEALKLISEAARSYAEKRIERLFADTLEDNQRGALQDAWQETMTHAYGAALDTLASMLLPLGLKEDAFRQRRTEILIFLENEEVGDLLWESICDLSNDKLPKPNKLRDLWAKTGWELPPPGANALWQMFAAIFRQNAKEKAFVTPLLQQILIAQTLDQIRTLTQQLLGVQVRVKQDHYVRRMEDNYARVDLANIAPAESSGHGVLVVTDIFEPQHVREDPPPVEITKDEFEELIRDGKVDEAILETIEEGQGKHLAQQLKFQRTSYAEQHARPVFDIISSGEKRLKLLVITGDAGSGKSTLLRYLLLGILRPPNDPEVPSQPIPWTTRFTGDDDHFPLLVELRDYYATLKDPSIEVSCLLEYITHLGKRFGWGIDGPWLQRRLDDGPSLLLFDGLDEIFDPLDRDKMMEEIAGIAPEYPKARIIVTSRPHGYHEGILRPVGFAHFRLQDLSQEQKERFTEGWFARVFPSGDPGVLLSEDAKLRIQRVLGAIKRSASVRWLAGNPLLITIMCLIARERELPRERTIFYEKCLDLLAHHWRLKEHLDDEKHKPRDYPKVDLNEEDKETSPP